MKKFRFLEWGVYKDAKILFFESLKITHSLSKEYRFELGSQLVRASLSVVLNIAEGSGKTSDKELNRYFDISLGSLHEVLALADTLRDGDFITIEQFENIAVLVENISKQLGGFKKKL